MRPDDDEDHGAEDFDTCPHEQGARSGTAVPTLIYTRGSLVVKRGSKHAGVGTMQIEGHTYDTFERLDGYVALKEGCYRCKMEVSPSGKTVKWKGKEVPRRQLRPLAHGAYNNQGRLAAILVHPGRTPGSFIGCIGVGRRQDNTLQDSVKCMYEVLDLCGGYAAGRVVHLVVKGTKPATPG
jgi:hypothetical protein